MQKRREIYVREHIDEIVEDPVTFEMRYGRMSLDLWRQVDNKFNAKELLTSMYYFYISTHRGTEWLSFENYIQIEYPYLKEFI